MIPTLLLLCAPAGAEAYGTSLDIELLQPTFGLDGFAGFDDLSPARFGAARVGLFTSYQQDPLMLGSVQGGTDLTPIVAHRLTTTLGATVALSNTFALRTRLPTAIQWGSQSAEFFGDGVLLGDGALGARLSQAMSSTLALGGTLDVLLPTSTPHTWMGEHSPRLRGSLLAHTRGQLLDVFGGVGATWRSAVDTGAQLTVGDELSVSLAARYHVLPDRLSMLGGALLRRPLTSAVAQRGQRAAELISGMELQHHRHWRTEFGVGMGVSDGYGANGYRLFVGLSRAWAGPRPPAPEPMVFGVAEVVKHHAPQPEPELEPESLEDLLWEPDELARVDAKAIVIRDPIQFAFGTEHILPESVPTLRYVARLMTEHLDITQLVIEGHSSDEGSFVYNYDLSIRRARAVWEALVRAGVHPDRMSYRGMGEVEPLSASQDEAQRAANRRVEFHIAARRDLSDPSPAVEPMPPVPWSGEPAPPEPPAPDSARPDGTSPDPE